MIDERIKEKMNKEILISMLKLFTKEQIDDLDEYTKRIFDAIMELAKENKELKDENTLLFRKKNIAENYLELICDLAYDYDGFNRAEDLKGLIDELNDLAYLARTYNTSEIMTKNGNDNYNILGEKIEGGSDVE